MPNNKKKNVSSIKGIDRAHPYSRKAAQFKRAVMRQDKLAHRKAEREEPRRRAVDRLVWFKYSIDDNTDKPLSEEEMHSIAMMYINRNDDEMEDLKQQLRKDRPKPAKLGMLQLLKEKDIKEYRDGVLEMPLMSDATNIRVLKEWDGDFNSMQRIKMTRMRMNG